MHVRTHTRHRGNNDLIDSNALFATIAASDNRQLTGRSAPQRHAGAATRGKLDGGKWCLHQRASRRRATNRENSVWCASLADRRLNTVKRTIACVSFVFLGSRYRRGQGFVHEAEFQLSVTAVVLKRVMLLNSVKGNSPYTLKA